MAKTTSKPKRVVSQETRQRQSRAALSLKQMRFVKEYAALGNGAEAARKAGYKNGNSIHQQAHENLRKPEIARAVEGELARIALEVSPKRVQRRLDEISHAAQADGQYGPAVRAEELLGKSIGMWIDQSLQLTGALSDTHIAALVDMARRRQQEPVDLGDDVERDRKRDSDMGEER
jgi:hypothetical protein